MECVSGSYRFFFRGHFYKSIPKRFFPQALDHSGGYHMPMKSEKVVELLIRKGFRETLNEQQRCHPSSRRPCAGSHPQTAPSVAVFLTLDMGLMSFRMLKIMKRLLLPRVGFLARR